MCRIMFVFLQNKNHTWIANIINVNNITVCIIILLHKQVLCRGIRYSDKSMFTSSFTIIFTYVLYSIQIYFVLSHCGCMKWGKPLDGKGMSKHCFDAQPVGFFLPSRISLFQLFYSLNKENPSKLHVV